MTSGLICSFLHLFHSFTHSINQSFFFLPHLSIHPLSFASLNINEACGGGGGGDGGGGGSGGSGSGGGGM